MKPLFFLSFTVLFSSLFAQQQSDRFTKKQDSIFNALSAKEQRRKSGDDFDPAKLGKKQFTRLINTEFTKVLNSNNGSNLGTFASLDTDESKISYAVTFLPGDKSKGNTAITVSVEGSNSDNILPVFSDDDFSKQFAIGFQVHHRLLGTITYLSSDRVKQVEEEIEIDRKHDNDVREAILDLPYRTKKLELDKWTREVQSLNDSIKKWTCDTCKQSLSDSVKIDQALVKILGLKTKIEARKAELRNMNTGEAKKERLDDAAATLISERSTAIDKARDKLKLTGFRSTWISYGLSFSNNSFKLFDSSLPFAEQLMDTSFFTKKLSLSLSQYSGLGDKSRYFWSIGFDISVTDNFNSFSEVNVQSRTNFDQTDPNQRFVITDTKAFQGDDPYEQDLSSLILRLDYYHFLFKGKNVAVHLFPRYNAIEGQTDNTIDFGFGVFTSLPKKGDSSSSVNAELFFNFVDTENAREAEGNIFDRSTLGLTFNVPIQF